MGQSVNETISSDNEESTSLYKHKYTQTSNEDDKKKVRNLKSFCLRKFKGNLDRPSSANSCKGLSMAVDIPVKQSANEAFFLSRYSPEDINEEIENLVFNGICNGSINRTIGSLEGHRAPVHSPSISSDLGLEWATDNDENKMYNDDGSSPEINQFLTEDPPSDCEKVVIRKELPSVYHNAQSDLSSSCQKFELDNAKFVLFPSKSSAFLPLKNTINYHE